MGRVVVIHGSVIKYRDGIYIIYPAREDREKLAKLHGEKIHAIIITEENM
ncbi:MAG: hypothetical protein J7L12_01060 [Desulfurococcales archaeon]|nr:hypothetical protein [Desulfurococcales archaeon]